MDHVNFQTMLQPTTRAPTFFPLVATPLHGRNYRKGKWTQAEIDYAYLMSDTFKEGLFDDGIPEGKSVRKWLATLLNCDPMRLSKKFKSKKLLGKTKLLGNVTFEKSSVALAIMSPEERMDQHNAMEAARRRFMESIGETPHRTYGHPYAATSRPRLVRQRPPRVCRHRMESSRSVSSPSGNVVSVQSMEGDGLSFQNTVDLESFDLEVVSRSLAGISSPVPVKVVASPTSVSWGGFDATWSNVLPATTHVVVEDLWTVAIANELQPFEWNEVSVLLADDSIEVV